MKFKELAHIFEAHLLTYMRQTECRVVVRATKTLRLKDEGFKWLANHL